MPRLPPLALAALLAVALTACTAPRTVPAPPSPSGSASWPVITGRVLESSSDGRTTRRRIAVRDPEAAYADARAQLVGAGFQLTKDRPGRGGGDGQACTPALCVDFSATVERPWGASVLYAAFHSTGVVPLG